MPTSNAEPITERALRIAIRRTLGLGLVAGYVNAVGFIDLGANVIAMAGNTVEVGVSLEERKWSYLVAAVGCLSSFFLGALVSSFIRRKKVHPAIELALVAALLVMAQIVRSVMPDPLVAELSLLSLAMAMQGETLSRFGCLPIQTVVATSNLLKLAEATVDLFMPTRDNPNRLRNVLLPGSAWLAYFAGACAAALVAPFGDLPFIPPAIILLAIAIDLHLVRVPEDAGSRPTQHSMPH